MAIETGLAERVVIVTGGADGIGRATALRFAQEGARVAVWDLAADDEVLVQALKAAGGEGCYQHVDVTDTAAVNTAIEGLVERWGRIDVLINNAGIIRDRQLVKWRGGSLLRSMEDEDFEAVIDVNLKGVFRATRAAVPHLIAGGGGVVLCATSVVGIYGNHGQTNYAAAKAGVIGMVRTWARELGRHKIRVNAVAPGFVDTAMARQVPAALLEFIEKRTPLGRIGDAAEVADAYLWLASDAASFVHGAVLGVDGGLVLGS